MWLAAVSVAVGAALGAVLRWGLGVWLNPLIKWLPLGTLVANWAGGRLAGVALAWFELHPQWPPAVRLLCVTGFLGGLTTFSTFSAEVTGLLLATQYAQALIAALLHLLGSLAMTVLGVSMVRLWL